MREMRSAEDSYILMYKGMVDKDERLLESVLHPSFVLIHMTGMRQHKDAFIRAVQDGTLNYSSTSHQNIKTEIDGDRATLTGKSLVHAAVFGGGWHTWHLRLDCRLVCESSRWLITEAKASTY